MTKPSILNGVRDVLGAPGDCKALPKNGLQVDTLIKCIEQNWSRKKSRGKSNWHLRHQPLKDPNKHKPDSEVRLERAIAAAFDGNNCPKNCPKNCLKNCLWNQMPTASGLLARPNSEDKGKEEPRRAVDLVYKPAEPVGRYEFLELKVQRMNGTQDSLHYAIKELFEYGLLYLFSRKNREVLGYSGEAYKVLDASHIGLRVIAPPTYYEKFDPEDESLCKEVNDALKTYLMSGVIQGLTMDIGLDEISCKATDSPQTIRDAFVNKQRRKLG